ncbi:MAG TPA: SAP domain-containing protein [bacterium]|nr:SAP domain-containing protein [bacterium]
MKINECIEKMSKRSLVKVLKAVLKNDVPKNADDPQLKKLVEDNVSLFSGHERIEKELNFNSYKRNERILVNEILMIVLESDDSIISEKELWEKVQEYEKRIVEKAKNNNISRVIGQNHYEIYKTILEVALEDDNMSPDEYNIVKKLRKKLKINSYQSRIIEAELGKFPGAENKLHSVSDFELMLKILQEKGILFYFKEKDECYYAVIPSEIENSVKSIMEFELGIGAHNKMLDKLKMSQLIEILKSFGLASSGKKEEIISRIIEAGFYPSEELDVLSNDELAEICRDLPGVNVTGTKPERSRRIIAYFNNLKTKIETKSEDERAKYYEVFEKLATRDELYLMAQNIIKDEKMIGSCFEKATRYLFEKKLGHDVVPRKGVVSGDGEVRLSDNEVLLWDNKSKRKDYKFCKDHQRQFKDYIDSSEQIVRVFLVIVPFVDKNDEMEVLMAARDIKNSTKNRTEIAIITAEDLKYIADKWRNFSTKEKFDLSIFNYTGVLKKNYLTESMKRMK